MPKKTVNDMKRCSKCKNTKLSEEFYKSRNSLTTECKQCTKERMKRYYQINQKQIRIKNNVYYEKNKDKFRKYYAKYSKQEENKLRARICQQNYYKKSKHNANFRLQDSISSVMWRSLKNNKRGHKTFEMLGYTVEKLKRYLESQFTDGMTWENYGKWHIDHIIPISFFQYISTEDVEFKMCWRLENLQPLWAKDNLRKSNKLSLTG